VAWETRPWATTPNPDVMRGIHGLFGREVKLTLDPRSYEVEDDRALRVSGTVLAVTNNGPTIIMEDGEKFALIDVLCIERMAA
jgi:hypothetical protein